MILYNAFFATECDKNLWINRNFGI